MKEKTVHYDAETQVGGKWIFWHRFTSIKKAKAFVKKYRDTPSRILKKTIEIVIK